MVKNLYHGSVQIIEHPVFGKGNPRNDYGLGFYCTENLDIAKEWACVENGDGFANRYRLDMDGLSICNLSDGNHHILNWLAILLENRTFTLSNGLPSSARDYILETFLPDYKNSDIIQGYRADDSYFAFANAFLNNTISFEQLKKAMYLGKLGEQVVLKSPKAFERIKFEEAILAENEVYYPKKVARDKRAREEFQKEKAGAGHIDSVFIIDMMRNRWSNDDERLR